MLKIIDSSYEEMKIMQERFKLIMEATNDGYFDFNLSSKELYIAPTWLSYVGYADSDGFVSFHSYMEAVYPDDRELFENTINECLETKKEHIRFEYRVFKKSGELLWVDIRGKIVEFDNLGKPVRLVGTISDISERKKIESENLYLSQTDIVTTLKNRAYVETVLKKADECSSCSDWIIIGDVNGLKIINDSFGQAEGDRILRAVGEIFKKCCSENDMPARWGGGEFIVFVKDKDESYVESLILCIKSECNNVQGYPVNISITFGRAQKDKKHPDMNSVLKLAEERMYRSKLLESRSARNAILASLVQSLHEKHIETEEHTRRIKQLCTQIGTKIGLSREELDELSLLGVLHDIGKIGIPEVILLKPDKLSKDEWEIMKTHTEIGYRIAASTPELAHIADEILSHHERYDGTGYPQGLKGKNIPKLSRLLAIVDSFDVMTHDRLYKKAMSIKSAVEELKSCSGKQFDPEMVEQFLDFLHENSISMDLSDKEPCTF